MTTSNADRIRSSDDKQLFDLLLEDRTVKRVNEEIERATADGPLGTRRRLLATSVRLSERMAPDVQKHAEACVEMLGLDIPIELYVFASPQYNAMCFKPEDGRLFVMFSSSLLEAFDDAEIRFVMGHELGHHAYRHHDIPIGYVLKGGKPSPRLALQLFAWSRYAEISADRAGAYCAQDITSVSRSLFKLASGLSGSSIRFNLQDFLEQIDDMQTEGEIPGQGAPQEDWFSTHPFSPLRVKALQLFDRSALMRESGTKVDELEVDVRGLMGMMEASYLEGRTENDEAMRRLLFAGALTVANAHNGVGEEEIAVFEKYFGEGSFDQNLDLNALAADLDKRIEQVREHTTTSQSMHVLRDLCVVARADGHIDETEREVLNRIADGLGVSRALICQTLDSDPELD
ncbi:MAG: M48 family metallopeptidase [Myxococcota bacterium]